VSLNDFEWLEWPFYVICSLLYELPLTNYLLLIYCSLFITRVTNACVCLDFGALKHGFRSLATIILVVMLSANFKPKRTVAASRGFLATARLSCVTYISGCTVVLIVNINILQYVHVVS